MRLHLVNNKLARFFGWIPGDLNKRGASIEQTHYLWVLGEVAGGAAIILSLGFGVQGSGLGAWGLGLKCKVLGFRVYGAPPPGSWEGG